AVQNSNAATGAGIRIVTAGGNAIINKSGVGSVTAGASLGTHIIDVTMAGGLTTINNSTVEGGYGMAGAAALLGATSVLRATGSGDIVFNNTVGHVSGTFQLAAFTGGFTFNNSSGLNGWFTRGDSTF